VKNKIFILLCILLTHGKCAISQDKYFEIKSGYIVSRNSGITLGLKRELAPQKEIFSVSIEVHYVFPNKNIIVPLELNLRFGNKVKFRTTAGFLPIIYLAGNSTTKKGFAVGGLCGFGLEIPIGKDLSIFCESNFHFVSGQEYHPGPSGNGYTDRIIDGAFHSNIGVQFSFGNKEK
jgi:hypothetical protein